MLAVSSYPKSYIDQCRSLIFAQIDAWTQLTATLTSDEQRTAASSLERQTFQTLILALDSCFVHRQRSVEGKDGNPINEVRMLCAAILSEEQTLSIDKTIKYSAETSVLGIGIGENVVVDASRFRKLADAYFSEIETRFGG